jgi:hypothetical protein
MRSATTGRKGNKTNKLSPETQISKARFSARSRSPAGPVFPWDAGKLPCDAFSIDPLDAGGNRVPPMMLFDVVVTRAPDARGKVWLR